MSVIAKETNDLWGYAENSTGALAEDLARYRVEIAPIYQCLWRLLVQLAGLPFSLKRRTHRAGPTIRRSAPPGQCLTKPLPAAPWSRCPVS